LKHYLEPTVCLAVGLLVSQLFVEDSPARSER